MLGSLGLKLRSFLAAVVLATSLGGLCLEAQGASPAFKVIAFYTGMKDEPAHISFVQEANRWLHIPTVVGHPFRFVSDSHSNSKRTPVPIDIGQ